MSNIFIDLDACLPIFPTSWFQHNPTAQALLSVQKQNIANSLKMGLDQSASPKKIIVFYSDGGGGHKSAWITLESCLKDSYIVEGFKIFEDPLGSLDPVRSFTMGYYTCEDFYNTILAGRWTGIVNQLYVFGKERIRSQKLDIEALVTKFLLEKQPDIVISVIPLLNGYLANVTQKLGLPFLVVPTDLDNTSFIYGLEAPYAPHFSYGLSFDDTLIRDKLAPAAVPQANTNVIGFPVRQNFFTHKNRAALKKEFHVPANKPVVMILMGAAGSTSSYRYVRKIARMDLPMHLLICLGRNERIRHKVERIRLPDTMSMSIIGFTPRIADLMAISDVLITKSGTVSVCEALHMHLPMILDNTTGSIVWEDFNLQFIEHYQFGDVLKDYNRLEELLAKYINDRNYRLKRKKNIARYMKLKANNFEKNVKETIHRLLTTPPADHAAGGIQTSYSPQELPSS